MFRIICSASAAIGALLCATSPTAAATRHHVVAEYALPSNPSLGALVAGPDGNMWVAGYNQISRVAPTGTVTTFATGANGDSIAVGPDRALWFGSANGGADLGRITTDGQVSYIQVPAPPGSSSYPLILGIVTGPDGNLWMTDYANAELIRLAKGKPIAYIPLGAGAYPYGIANGPDGALWVADRAGRLERVTIAGQVSSIGLPGFSGVESVTLGGDGNLWVNNGNGSLGRVTPAGQLTSFPIPQRGGVTGTVHFVSTDRAGNIWFTAWFAYPHENAGVMTTTGAATLLHVPTSGSGAYAIAPGVGGKTTWFTEAFANKVAKAK